MMPQSMKFPAMLELINARRTETDSECHWIWIVKQHVVMSDKGFTSWGWDISDTPITVAGVSGILHLTGQRRMT